MKKKIFLIFSLILMFALTGCDFLDKIVGSNPTNITINPTVNNPNLTGPDDEYEVASGDKNGYNVTYYCNNGYVLNGKTTSNKIVKPKNPSKLCATFQYWCSDEALTKEFNFNTTVSQDINLYAKYVIDFAELTNTISSTIMKSNVRIECQYYNGAIYGSSSSTSLGSGIIISEDSNYYYCLTNNHVVYKDTNYKYAKYVIEDCYENEYDGKLIANINTYDLAIIQFEKSNNKELGVISMSPNDYIPFENEYIIALGEPLGQSNCITYGKILNNNHSFDPDEDTKNLSYVTFDVISHTANIANGSSGGALLDTNLNLVGINFASSIDKDTNESIRSYAIPIDKVSEFLDEYL